jgi:WD40 repeat protein
VKARKRFPSRDREGAVGWPASSQSRLGRLVLCTLLILALGGSPRIAPAAEETIRPHVDRYGDPLPDGAIARLGTLRFRESWMAHSLAISPDGRTLASGTVRGIELWDAATGRKRLTCLGGCDSPRTVFYAPDGKTLFAGNKNGTISLWDPATGKLRRQFRGQSKHIWCLALTRDGKVLGSAESDGAVHIWDVGRGKETHRLPFPSDGIRCLAFSADGKMVAAVGTKGTTPIRLWDVATGKKRTQWYQDGSPTCLAFAPDGKTVAIGLDRGPQRICIRRLPGGAVLRQLGEHEDTVTDLAYSPDGQTLAVVSADGRALLWDPTTGRVRRRLEGCPVWRGSLAFSADGQTVAAMGAYGILYLWDTATGKDRRPASGHEAIVQTVAYRGSNVLATASIMDRTFRLWDLPGAKETRRLPLPRVTDAPTAIFTRYVPPVIAPHGRTMALLGDENICFLDTVTGKEKTRIAHVHDDPSIVVFSPRGDLVASPDWRNRIVLGATATAKQSRVLSGHEKRVTFLVFSPDGQTLVSGSLDGTIRVWDVARGKELRCHGGQGDLTRRSIVLGPAPAALSPGGKLLALGESELSEGAHRVRLWDVATGTLLARFGKHEWQISSLAFSPDGRFLASVAFGEGGCRLWEVATMNEVRRIGADVDGLLSVTFSPDGRTLATGNCDTTALVWDVTGLAADGRLPGLLLSPAKTKALWTELKSADSAGAHRALWALVAGGKQPLPLLREWLRPVPIPDRARLGHLITNLDDQRYAVRKKAMSELEHMGETAGPALRRALEERPSLEVRQRIRQVLTRAASLTPEKLRAIRAVHVVEQIDSPPARRLLQVLAQGAPEARLTQEAKAALARMGQRSVKP